MEKNFRYEQTNESKKKQNIQETVEFILDKEYGTTIAHTEIGKILGYNVNDEIEFIKYKSMMIKVKNFLLQYGYVLKSISGIGYYILKPSQISSHCYKAYIKKAGRTYDKSLYILGRVDETELTAVRKEELENIRKLNEQLVESTEKILVESKYYSRKNYYDTLDDNKHKENSENKIVEIDNREKYTGEREWDIK